MKLRIAAATAATVLALTLTGCGEEEQPDSQPVGFAQMAETATETPAPADSEQSKAAAQLAGDDAAYLEEVNDRIIPGSILGQFSDAEIIAMGHDACKQIGDGVALEDLQLVPGEKRLPDENGSWRDSSAVFNSALLNYCHELLEPRP